MQHCSIFSFFFSLHLTAICLPVFDARHMSPLLLEKRPRTRSLSHGRRYMKV